MTRYPPWLAIVLALLAVAFLIFLASTGNISPTRQLVKFEAKGVLKVLPDRVQQVAMTVGAHTITVDRHPEHGWRRQGSDSPVSAALQEHLSMAVLLMHGSGPLRVMPRTEYGDTALQDFGLEQPRYSVVCAAASGTLLEAHFGAVNPQGLLQYMRLAGHDDIYLMSRFVGEAWEHVWEHLSAPEATP